MRSTPAQNRWLVPVIEAAPASGRCGEVRRCICTEYGAINTLTVNQMVVIESR